MSGRFSFEVTDLASANVARAALDGMIAQFMGQKVQRASAPHQVNGGAAPTENGQETIVEGETGGEPDTGTVELDFSREQMKEAAKVDPVLADILSKRGAKSNAIKAEMNRRTGAVLQATPKAEAQVGKALEGATAEELKEALAKPNGNGAAKPNGNGNGQGSILQHLMGEADEGETETAEQETKPGRSIDDAREALDAYASEIAPVSKSLKWFNAVLQANGAKTVEDLTVEQIERVLDRPDQFLPA